LAPGPLVFGAASPCSRGGRLPEVDPRGPFQHDLFWPPAGRPPRSRGRRVFRSRVLKTKTIGLYGKVLPPPPSSEILATPPPCSLTAQTRLGFVLSQDGMVLKIAGLLLCCLPCRLPWPSHSPDNFFQAYPVESGGGGGFFLVWPQLQFRGHGRRFFQPFFPRLVLLPNFPVIWQT